MGGEINERISATERDAWDHEIRISHLERTQQTQSSLIDYLMYNAIMANKLIAMNMFAIVRLELATCVDQIITDALVVKRSHTSSKTVKAVAQCATALAVMAGNVVSAGGLTAVGQIICGASNALNGAIQNDPKASVSGIADVAAGGLNTNQVDATTGKSTKEKLSFNETQMAGTNASTTNQAKIAEQTAAPLYAAGLAIYKAANKSSIEVANKNFHVQRHAVIFDKVFKHGAGGTSAITYDVTYHIADAYKEMVNLVEQEVKGDTDHKLSTQGKDILQALTQEGQFAQKQASYHPLTRYVLSQALQTLISRSTEYKKLTGGSGHWLHNALPKAKAAVNLYYNALKTQIDRTGEVTLPPEKLQKIAKALDPKLITDMADKFNRGVVNDGLIDIYQNKKYR